MPQLNRHSQPVGDDLDGWETPPFPPEAVLSGDRATLEPLDAAAHAHPLYEVFKDAPDDLWTYMSFGPFPDETSFTQTLESMTEIDDWVPYAINANNRFLGFASYLRIDPEHGVIEIGSITFSPPLQRTMAATEALYLMMAHVFDLGYRRCEWKCDDLNAPSRAAALRLGFAYEGTFRQATHYKGRNRDTAWYSIIDSEWPRIDDAFQSWLSPENFEEDGTQKHRLHEMR